MKTKTKKLKVKRVKIAKLPFNISKTSNVPEWIVELYKNQLEVHYKINEIIEELNKI